MSTSHFKIPKTVVNFKPPKATIQPHSKCCCYCKKTKQLDEFSLNNKRRDGHQTYCKSCGYEKQTEWYYQRKHGITIEERDALLASQSGICLICENPIAFKQNKGRGMNTGEEAVLDHCHTSGEIRGVLCGHCNTGIGALRDNVRSLQNAIKYLTER